MTRGKPTTLRWALQHGMPRVALLAAARRDDPLARMILDPAARSHPEPYFERIRSDGQLSRGRLMYITASHAAAKQVLKSGDFGVGDAYAAYPRLLGNAVRWSQQPESLRVTDAPSMAAVDDPDHARYRRLVSRAFTARTVERLRDRIEAVTERTLDEMAKRGDADLATSFSLTLPITIIADILGVPEDEAPVLQHFGMRLGRSIDAGQSLRDFRRTDRDVRAFNRWLHGHLERLRRAPGDNLLSALVCPERAEDELSPVELQAIAGLLLNAGFMTTTTMLTSGADLLLRHPEERARLEADPSLWGNAIDEILRMDAPLRVSARTAMRPTEVQGQPLEPGTRVVVLVTAANRDPEAFDDPDRFDVARANAHDHLAFSVGRHFCIGSGLARLEGEIGLHRLLERFPDLRLRVGAERRAYWGLSAWKALPVSLGTPGRPHAASMRDAASDAAGVHGAGSPAAGHPSSAEPSKSAASIAERAALARAAAGSSRSSCPAAASRARACPA
ncbi:MAG TPA: cytochrome P450 [Mycobacteriales bacterium]|nr:cytochrome P450 [Mycobacteriales bacterium]